MAGKYRRGDVVVYSRQKASESPGPRAREVSPSSSGEIYTYIVDKFWIVGEELSDGRLRLLTRSGKEHLVAADDERLRRVRLLERIFMRHKFPALSVIDQNASNLPSSN